jgi:hypothetical protein
MKIQEIMNRHPADTTFSGYGAWDVFGANRRFIGTVIFYQLRPPFVLGHDPRFDYAPGYHIFAVGVVKK